MEYDIRYLDKNGLDLCFPHAVKAIILQDEKIRSLATDPIGHIWCRECEAFKAAEKIRHGEVQKV